MNDVSMSRNVYDLLNGQDLAGKQHEAMLLLSVSEDGWPHTAMLSVGEVVAISDKEVRIGLWPATTTTANLIRTCKATIVLFYKGKAVYMGLSVERLEELDHAKYPRERFAAKLVSFREDAAKYADITSGVQIELKQPEEVIKRWENTIQELLL